MANVLEVDVESWDREVLGSDILTIVDFWHERCPWCLLLNPVFEEVAQKYEGRVKFVKLNVLKPLENRELAVRYGVMGTPTLIFFCAGRPVGEMVGFAAKEDLEEAVEEMLKKHKECLAKSSELEFDD